MSAESRTPSPNISLTGAFMPSVGATMTLAISELAELMIKLGIQTLELEATEAQGEAQAAVAQAEAQIASGNDQASSTRSQAIGSIVAGGVGITGSALGGVSLAADTANLSNAQSDLDNLNNWGNAIRNPSARPTAETEPLAADELETQAVTLDERRTQFDQIDLTSPAPQTRQATDVPTAAQARNDEAIGSATAEQRQSKLSELKQLQKGKNLEMEQLNTTRQNKQQIVSSVTQALSTGVNGGGQLGAAAGQSAQGLDQAQTTVEGYILGVLGRLISQADQTAQGDIQEKDQLYQILSSAVANSAA
jgi:hypothetical protein